MKRKEYKHVIFDMDGTLTDSKPGIINAAIYASKEMGVKDIPVEQLNNLIGIPLQDYFKIIYGYNNVQVDEAVYHFRKYYGEKGVYENKVYPGIMELFNELFNSKIKIYISTAKYEKYAKVVIRHFNFERYLTDMIGADAAGLHATKTELASVIIKRNNITGLTNTVTVGDKYMDMQAGKDNDIDTIGVTYGFGSREELENENPTYIVDTTNELKYALLNT